MIESISDTRLSVSSQNSKLYARRNFEVAEVNPSSSCSRTVGATLSAGSLAALHTSARKLETGTQLYLHVTVKTSMTIHPCMRASFAFPTPITCSTQNDTKLCTACTILFNT